MKHIFLLLSAFCMMAVELQAQTDSLNVKNDSLTWTKMLDEVIVKGNHNIVRSKGNAIVVNVANTELSRLGTANDVLSRLPFVNMDGEEIKIVGKGKPAVFIDNRLVRNDNELQMLKSENIKNIQIIYSPGVKYSSEVKAIIKIQTVQSRANGFSGKVTMTNEMRSQWSVDLSVRRYFMHRHIVFGKSEQSYHFFK